METELLARGVAAEHAALAAELFDEADQAFPYLDPKEGSSDGFMSDWEEYYDATHQRFFYRRRNGNGTWAVPPALQFQQWLLDSQLYRVPLTDARDTFELLHIAVSESWSPPGVLWPALQAAERALYGALYLSEFEPQYKVINIRPKSEMARHLAAVPELRELLLVAGYLEGDENGHLIFDDDDEEPTASDAPLPVPNPAAPAAPAAHVQVANDEAGAASPTAPAAITLCKVPSVAALAAAEAAPLALPVPMVLADLAADEAAAEAAATAAAAAAAESEAEAGTGSNAAPAADGSAAPLAGAPAGAAEGVAAAPAAISPSAAAAAMAAPVAPKVPKVASTLVLPGDYDEAVLRLVHRRLQLLVDRCGFTGSAETCEDDPPRLPLKAVEALRRAEANGSNAKKGITTECQTD